MKKFLKILRGLVIVLLCLVLLVNLWLLAARFLLRQDLPKLFGYSQAIVVSGSMEPTFSVGDMVVFKKREQYEMQDVVIFRQGGSFVTHRIVGTAEGGFITQGDANNAKDQDILDPKQIEGAMVAIIPWVGGVISFLRTPLGLLILILTGFALIEGPQITAKLKKNKREEKR
ncbi:signal peptidase I [Zongyangia hominis]|uniref:Signal peptidase I n=1 Tax=Zongyangia hominis TaxID=2763677 RepID=A0A926ICK2_9FIRM|nr:signal peptidase I [Zongyangia hominis]MBC8571215.1 signal peptidase I [Zongyangia hominis]